MVTSRAVVGSVRNQKLQVTCKRDGNVNTLLHTARELVRIVVIAASRDANHFQHIARLFFGFLPGELRMVVADDLEDLLADGHNRVQRCHGILEDHRDLPTAHLAHFFFGQPQKIMSFVDNLAGNNFSGRMRNQSHDTARECRFACAGLADQTQGLAAPNLQICVVQRTTTPSVVE